MSDEPKKNETKISKNVEKLIDEISKLSVIELSQLVSGLQDRLGITPTQMATTVATAPTPATPEPTSASSTPSAGTSGATTQTLVMTQAGENKIAVIKALREINQNLGLKEAKDATENVPFEVLKDAKAEEVKSAAEKLKAAGATVEIK